MSTHAPREFRNRGNFPGLLHYKGSDSLTLQRENVAEFPRFLDSRAGEERAGRLNASRDTRRGRGSASAGSSAQTTAPREFRNRGNFPGLSRCKGGDSLTLQRETVEKFPRFLDSRADEGKRRPKTPHGGNAARHSSGDECGAALAVQQRPRPGKRGSKDAAPREFRNRGNFSGLLYYKGNDTLTLQRETVEKFPRFLDSRENREKRRRESSPQGGGRGNEEDRHGRQRARR